MFCSLASWTVCDPGCVKMQLLCSSNMIFAVIINVVFFSSSSFLFLFFFSFFFVFFFSPASCQGTHVRSVISSAPSLFPQREEQRKLWSSWMCCRSSFFSESGDSESLLCLTPTRPAVLSGGDIFCGIFHRSITLYDRR